MRTLIKRLGEFAYWTSRRLREGSLAGPHYEYLFTTHFGLERDFYTGKRLIDIGCGPRGSLEWADDAEERVGLDPLADSYRRLGSRDHKMRYVNSGAEHIPFADGYFDVVSSFNSLDHVESLQPCVDEMVRVLKPGGSCLLICDVNHAPTLTEPLTLDWHVVDLFTPLLEAVNVRRFEKTGGGMYETLVKGVRYDDSDTTPRPGVLSALMVKR